jgi:predicted esterase
MLDTVFIKNPENDKCIIFFHGNAGNISMRFDMIKFLYNYASVLIFDYRSFGKSSGEISNLSSHGLIKDAEAIWEYTIKKLNFKANNISFFGESLGCSIAIYLTAKLSNEFKSENYPHSLILNSPFYSLKSMIKIMFDKIKIGFAGKIVSLFFGREYMSNEWIKMVNHRTKIIIAHSPRDEIVPYSEGLNLYNQISKAHVNSKFINITGTHNNLGLTDNYIYTLADLFNE